MPVKIINPLTIVKTGGGGGGETLLCSFSKTGQSIESAEFSPLLATDRDRSATNELSRASASSTVVQKFNYSVQILPGDGSVSINRDTFIANNKALWEEGSELIDNIPLYYQKSAFISYQSMLPIILHGNFDFTYTINSITTTNPVEYSGDEILTGVQLKGGQNVLSAGVDSGVTVSSSIGSVTWGDVSTTVNSQQVSCKIAEVPQSFFNGLGTYWNTYARNFGAYFYVSRKNVGTANASQLGLATINCLPSSPLCISYTGTTTTFGGYTFTQGKYYLLFYTSSAYYPTNGGLSYLHLKSSVVSDILAAFMGSSKITELSNTDVRKTTLANLMFPKAQAANQAIIDRIVEDGPIAFSNNKYPVHEYYAVSGKRDITAFADSAKIVSLTKTVYTEDPETGEMVETTYSGSYPVAWDSRTQEAPQDSYNERDMM